MNLLTMPIFPKPVGVHNETDSSRTIVEWLHEVSPERGWKILVTQIPCDCQDSSLPDSLAPTGCLQYHTGITGTISSFNFHGTIMNYEPCYFGNETTCGAPIWTGHLNSLDYSTCIRSAPGYCGIALEQKDEESFQLSGLDSGNTPFPRNGENDCTEDYLFIPRGQHPSDISGQYTEERYCGQVMGNKLAGPVLSYAKPFLVMTRTDGAEASSGVALNNRQVSTLKDNLTFPFETGATHWGTSRFHVLLTGLQLQPSHNLSCPTPQGISCRVSPLDELKLFKCSTYRSCLSSLLRHCIYLIVKCKNKSVERESMVVWKDHPSL